jgi:DNA-binding MarR family transcriptional regulator
MATRDPVKKFAEQALQIDKLLNQRGVNGNAGRVILILNAASKPAGVTQKQVVAETDLPKDVVSKQVAVLVAEGLLDQKRDVGNSQIKRLCSTEKGKELLAAVKEILRPSREGKPDPVLEGEALVPGTFDFAELLNGN